jgi:hypothetical protein
MMSAFSNNMLGSMFGFLDAPFIQGMAGHSGQLPARPSDNGLPSGQPSQG